jgi:hypothetical protein
LFPANMKRIMRISSSSPSKRRFSTAQFWIPHIYYYFVSPPKPKLTSSHITSHHLTSSHIITKKSLCTLAMNTFMDNLLKSLPSRPSEVVIVNDNAKKLENPRHEEGSCWNLKEEEVSAPRNRDRWFRLAPPLSRSDSSLSIPQRQSSLPVNQSAKDRHDEEPSMILPSLSSLDELLQCSTQEGANKECRRRYPQQRRWSSDGISTRKRCLDRRRRMKSLEGEDAPPTEHSLPIIPSRFQSPQSHLIITDKEEHSRKRRSSNLLYESTQKALAVPLVARERMVVILPSTSAY